MKIQLHPDGTIIVHDDTDELLYRATPDVLQAELQASLPPLPLGMVRFDYDAESKILIYYDFKGNAFPVEGQAEAPACLAPALAKPAPALEQIYDARLAAEEAEKAKPQPASPFEAPATIPVG